MHRSLMSLAAGIGFVLIAGMVFGAAAAAYVLTPCAVLVVIWQNFEARRLALADFEQGLCAERREVAAMVPSDALLAKKLTKEAQAQAKSLFLRYFDVCNQQAVLFRQGRIREETWSNWLDEIGATLRLPSFARAWGETKAARPEAYQELQRLEADGFVVIREPAISRFPSDPESLEEIRAAA